MNNRQQQQKLHELIELLCRLNIVRDDHLTFRAARTRLFFLPLKNQIFFLHDKSAFFFQIFPKFLVKSAGSDFYCIFQVNFFSIKSGNRNENNNLPLKDK